MMEDTQLVRRLLARDKHAVATFYRTYAPRLRRFIGVKVASREDAEEILQDTLFAFLEGIRDFSGRSSVGTYLFGICQHKVIDFYRRRKFRHVVFSRMPQLEAIVSTALNPEEELDVTLAREKIHRVLRLLLPVHREILVLKYLDGLSVDEIAGRLVITFKSAESRLFRARRAFVEAFLAI
jgi:RNA polymerase sigma-70 factor (ECF subfamily)